MEQQELDRRTSLLSACPPLAALSPRGKLALALRMEVLEYQRGTVLYYQKEVAQYLYFNVAGQVQLRFSFIPTADSSSVGLRRITALTSSNKKFGLVSDTKVLKRIGPMQPFGLEAIRQSSYRTKATCKTNGVLYRLPVVLAKQSAGQIGKAGLQIPEPEPQTEPQVEPGSLAGSLTGSLVRRQSFVLAESQLTRELLPSGGEKAGRQRKSMYSFERKTANLDLIETEIININNECKQLRLFCNQSRTHSRQQLQHGVSSRHVHRILIAGSKMRSSNYRQGQPSAEGLGKSLQVLSARRSREEPVGKRDVLIILKNLYGL